MKWLGLITCFLVTITLSSVFARCVTNWEIEQGLSESESRVISFMGIVGIVGIVVVAYITLGGRF